MFKKILLLSAFFISFMTFAQVPQGISYQAIALNSSGTPVVSANVRVKLSILDVSAAGSVLYSETQLRMTNPNGLFNLTIGQGTVVSGTFNTINWGTNSKFLKVEMDVTGGTTYALVGTTQLLSVPYALAADSLVTSAGEGITLVSPNGTPYTLSVNDSGQLSLPTTTATNNVPGQLYMYGSFNSFNPATALPLGQGVDYYTFFGYTYLSSGATVKFIPQNTPNTAVYGIGANSTIMLNGGAYVAPVDGFYLLKASFSESLDGYYFESDNLSLPEIVNNNDVVVATSTYSTSTNKFTFTVNGVTTSNNNPFVFRIGGYNYGDNLNNGAAVIFGSSITFPNVTSTPKNFRVELTLNSLGAGTYTITQI